MKTRKIIIGLLTAVFLCCLMVSGYVYASTALADKEVICDGVTMGQFDLSGLTKDEAMDTINEYVEKLGDSDITFSVEGEEITYKVSDFNLEWTNSDAIEEAVELGKKGNVLERYKSVKDIENDGYSYEFILSIDEELLKDTLDEDFAEYEIPVVNSTVTRKNGEFIVTESSEGLGFDIDTTVSQLLTELTSPEWDGSNFTIDVVTQVLQPEYTEADFSDFSDEPLGSKTTTYTSNAYNRNANIRRATELINGTVVYPGEEFNTNDILNPFTYENGYYDAGQYENGRVVDGIGGGVCQVSSTLFNAVLYSELEITERWAHSMAVSYLPLSADAALAGDYKNFKFVNNTDYPIYVEGLTTSTSVTFNIYGVETRDSDRTIEFISETIATYAPEADVVTEDPTLPVGTTQITSQAHEGSKAQLWKVVYYKGKEQSREVIYTSSYKSSPNYVTVGTMPVEETSAEGETPAEETTNEAGEIVTTEPTETSGEIETIPESETPTPDAIIDDPVQPSSAAQ